MQQEFAEVVYVFGDEGSDGEVVSAVLRFLGTEVCSFDAGEVEEGGAVVGGEVVLCLDAISYIVGNRSSGRLTL